MSAVDSKYSVDVIIVGETSLRVEVQRMHRRTDDERPMRLVGMRLAAPFAPAVSIRLGPKGVRRMIAALEQAAADAFDANDDEASDDAPDERARTDSTRPRKPGLPRGRTSP